MLQYVEEADDFVTIDLESDNCQLCHRDSGEEVTHCKICGNLLKNGPVRFGFNDMRGILHANKLGHEHCFKEEHYASLQHSFTESPPSANMQQNGRRHLRAPANHVHASSLPKPTQLSLDWMNNFQNKVKSHSNPSTRSSSPIHLGRRGSNPLSNEQLLELRRNSARYLFGENSPEFEQYLTLNVPSETLKEDHYSFVDVRSLKKTPSIELKSIPQVIKNRTFWNLPVPFNSNSNNIQSKEYFSSGKRSKDWTNFDINLNEKGDRKQLLKKGNVAVTKYTKSELENLGFELLKEIIDTLQHIVTETSTDLVSLLEERDNLKHENDTRHITIQKLVQLKTVALKSSPTMPRK
ncbi:hypothetical protein BSL78_08962 [Apostichopus japonicus]|uniref:Uncharacterized protein n=1 Tax=Stichopus japonicus TaxID=307972 RepID=A0A2G8L1J4_STIJA|nr:hypothetical protein BSL78_08962 [Apostichopus japonicus]